MVHFYTSYSIKFLLSVTVDLNSIFSKTKSSFIFACGITLTYCTY